MSEITYVRRDATAPSVKGLTVRPDAVQTVPSYGHGRAMKGRGELRDRPHTTVGHPPSPACTAKMPAHPAERFRKPAGGKWSRVEPLIAERLVRRGIAVTVHDQGEGPS